jgi:tRNA G18 (ribose-2'-O)-methylase SpoU
VSDRIEDLEDPRLAPYVHVGDAAWLRDRDLFVAEGRLVVERLLDAGVFDVHSILVTPAAERALDARLSSASAPVLVCDQPLLNGITGFNFHRGCLALARRPAPFRLDAWLERDGILLALEGVGNPDNVGGLFRTARALGSTGILIDPTTADPLYRKSIRTSMAATLQLPWAVATPWPDALACFKQSGYRIVALTPSADALPLATVTARKHRRVILLVGAEGPGLRPETLTLADDLVRIPMVAGADSLNVTVATGIALNAFVRVNPEP